MRRELILIKSIVFSCSKRTTNSDGSVEKISEKKREYGEKRRKKQKKPKKAKKAKKAKKKKQKSEKSKQPKKANRNVVLRLIKRKKSHEKQETPKTSIKRENRLYFLIE